MNENSERNEQADFISTVSHELRTPLTSIRGFADTLLASGDRLSEEQKKRFLSIIKEQTERLIKLTENLLTVSNSNNREYVFKKIEATEIINNCISIVKKTSDKNTFNVDFAENLPEILVDTDKFQQVILNVLENAVKYSYDNTEIKVKVRADDKFLIISVSDTGEVISEENYEKIFEKFVRLNSHLTQKVEGSGLGLFITKNIVEKMDGEIFAKSEGCITTFTVKFPIAGFIDDLKKRFEK